MVAKTILDRLKRLVKHKRVVIGLTTLVVAFAGLVFLYQRVDARSKIDSARRADAIIVLGSAVWPGGRPSPSLYARTQHAIALYQSGYAPYLIFCGGLGGNPPTEAEVMRRLATSAGVPASAMILEDQSHSTDESLANAQALMNARGLKSAIIVSDPFHLLRAEIIARDLGIEAYGSGARNSPTYTRTNQRVWYTLRESIALVWYYATRVAGEPAWLYGILKGKI
jgi:uncharacterized SAM-binding protein YcdF (DUF218 family)